MTFEEARDIANKYEVITTETEMDDGDETWWYATCRQFPGLLGDGETPSDADSDIRDVIAYAIVRRALKNAPIPS